MVLCGAACKVKPAWLRSNGVDIGIPCLHAIVTFVAKHALAHRKVHAEHDAELPFEDASKSLLL